jgi:acid stress-induced BolA-like protein IbaG/YrbA
MTPERIREILKEKGVAGDHIVVVGNIDEERAEMTALTDALAPAGKEREVAPLVHGAEIDGEMKAAISDKYVRAVAKIGFHFFLKILSDFLRARTGIRRHQTFYL